MTKLSDNPNRYTKLSQLEVGKVYNVFSVQFNALNKQRLISFDTTDMNRPISYWQYTERGHQQITGETLKQLFAEDHYTGIVQAMWEHEINSGYIITDIPQQPQAQEVGSLITLTAKKVREKTNVAMFYRTEFYKEDGTLFATIPVEQAQPRRGRKTIVLNCWLYNLQWVD